MKTLFARFAKDEWQNASAIDLLFMARTYAPGLDVEFVWETERRRRREPKLRRTNKLHLAAVSACCAQLSFDIRKVNRGIFILESIFLATFGKLGTNRVA